MNSDSANPNINSNSAFSHEEADDNSILPDAEVESVIRYLRAHSITVDNDSQDNKAPSLSQPPVEDINKNQQSTDNKAENVDANQTSPNKKQEDESEQILDLNDPNLQPLANLNKNLQVRLKPENDKLLLILPSESPIPTGEIPLTEIWQQIKLRLNGRERLQSSHAPVHLVAGNRLLDVRHLQELGEILREHNIQLKSVSTSRRQTAIAAATAGYSVEQVQIDPLLYESKSSTTPVADALYLEMTVRSGIEIRHPGSVIILGDVNPGGNLVADGDILVWGRLRGIAHAGAGGNRHCLIMALQMEPTQLRIADTVARAPEKSLTQFYPEVAYIAPEGIRIAKTNDFSRPQFANLNLPDEE